MQKSIGVFICHCGKSLYKNINIEELFQQVWQFPDIAYAGVYSSLCLEQGLEKMMADIKAHNINRLVIAACSPVIKESLFYKTIKKTGIDSHFFTFANIREQCSWAHTEIVTEKAIEIVRMAVNRICLSIKNKKEDVDVLKKVLVIGKGIDGINSALEISRLGLKTTLLTGNSISNKLIANKNITVLTHASVMSINGNTGNFSVKIKKGGENFIQNYGAIIFATGKTTGNASDHLNLQSDTIIEQQKFANLIQDSQVKTINSIIKKSRIIVFAIDFSGDSFRYSVISSLKYSLMLKSMMDCEVYIFCKNLTVDSDGIERLYRKARKLGVIFVKYKEKLKIVSNGNGKIEIKAKDLLLNDDVHLFCDLLIVQDKFLPCNPIDGINSEIDAQGFYQDVNVHLYPVSSRRKGIFFAGECRGDLDSNRTYTDILSAAIAVYELVSKDKVKINTETIKVKPEKCRACLTCIRVCPHGAIQLIPLEKNREVARVFNLSCYDCGICTSFCPAKAIEFSYYSDEQIIADIEVIGEERIIVFCCAESAYLAADRAGKLRMHYSSQVRIIRVPCIGRVDLIHILKAFEKGAKGVLLAGCPEGACTHFEGNIMAKKRVEYTKKILDEIGVNSERIKMINTGHTMAHTFVQEIYEMTKIVKGEIS